MIKTIHQLKNEYLDYKNILCKVSNEEKKGSLIRLKRGLYETNKYVDPILLANHIESPSYVSFETALSYYGMIPEKVYEITSASFNKCKSNTIKNSFGVYTYNDIPQRVYSDGVTIDTSKEYGFFIATKEKAILDMLYKLKTINSMSYFKNFLFDDLRIDENVFKNLNYNLIVSIGKKYHDSNINMFIRFIKENNLYE